MKYFCNPLNLDYRYQIKDMPAGKAVFREAADPTMVVFRGQYLLFSSMSGGFWYSGDLHTWQFRETPELPIYHYAPDVQVVGGQVLFCASQRGENCTFYRSPDPLRVPFTPVSAPFSFWDPAVFQDEDGRVYLYWGCSDREPLYGVELDGTTLSPLGEPKILIGENQAIHGWERNGENNRMGTPRSLREVQNRWKNPVKPYIEGPYVNKYQGKYYLQYAAPGTEYNVYSNGVYISDAPLGPWRYQGHNPFSSVPGGFLQGAGHGSTFRDLEGNWWHVSTMRISVNEVFERRIGLFPCGFDGDGILFCNQNFATHPQILPQGAGQDLGRIGPAMHLLSYRAAAVASSIQKGFGPEKGVDENGRSWWAAADSDPDPWYRIDLGEVKTVQAVQVNFADHRLPMPPVDREEAAAEGDGFRLIRIRPQRTAYVLEGSADGECWEVLRDNRKDNTDLPHDFWVLQEPKRLRYLRLSRMALPMGGVAAVSGLRVFGRGNGKAPRQVERLFFRRSRDGRDLYLRWPKAPGAQGYNVRWGTAPDKLYGSWQVPEKTELDLSLVTAGTRYYIAVDSYNENGVTRGKVFRADKSGDPEIML